LLTYPLLQAKIWVCRLCGNQFTSQKSKRTHAKKHHQQQDAPGPEKDKDKAAAVQEEVANVEVIEEVTPDEKQGAPGPGEEQDKVGAVLEEENVEVMEEVESSGGEHLNTPDLAEAWPGLAEGADRAEQEVKVKEVKVKHSIKSISLRMYSARWSTVQSCARRTRRNRCHC
jgi:hypothetical protein